MRHLLGLAFVAALVAPASALTFYTTSFETSDGFAVGDLDGQSGWAHTGNYSVETGHARSGSQSVQWTDIDGGYAWVDLPSAYSGTEALLSQVFVFLDPASANDERVFGLRLWGNTAASVYQGGAGVTIDSSGVIRAGDAYSEMWDDSNIVGNVTDPTGRWIRLQIEYTPGATTAIVDVDGTDFAVDIATAFAEVTDVDLFSEWRDVEVDSTAWYDDYSVGVVPEPATMMALGTGAAALLARRRRRS